MSFQGKKVLITGASRGIGRQIAIEFAKQGANVGVNYIKNDKAAEETIKLMEGSSHLLFKNNISDAQEAQRLIESFVDRMGSIDVLVNNAGISNFHKIDEVDYETWQNWWSNIVDTNLMAAANLCYLAAQEMIKARSGRIVNLTSRGAYRGEPEQMAYGASKAAINSLTQSLAKALGKYNVFVNAVAPGFTETDMGISSLSETEKDKLYAETPLGRMAKPEEVAKAVLYMASEGSEYTSGSILDINGASYFR